MYIYVHIVTLPQMPDFGRTTFLAFLQGKGFQLILSVTEYYLIIEKSSPAKKLLPNLKLNYAPFHNSVHILVDLVYSVRQFYVYLHNALIYILLPSPAKTFTISNLFELNLCHQIAACKIPHFVLFLLREEKLLV